MQLQEILLAAGVGIVVVGWAMQLGFAAWRQSIRSMEQVYTAQEIVLAREEWRRFIHASPADLRLAGGALATGSACRAEIAGNLLLLESRGRGRSLSLPRGVQAEMVREAQTTGPDLWVLNVVQPDPQGIQARRRCVRLVACRPEG